MSEPRHAKISRELLKDIAAGKYGPGARLPSEAQLCKKFGVSRPTVGRALRELQEQGLIDRRVGSGTYVRASRASADPAAYRQLGLLVPGLGKIEIHRPTSSRSWGPNPHDSPSFSMTWSQCAGYSSR